jgi:hypothetical protein
MLERDFLRKTGETRGDFREKIGEGSESALYFYRFLCATAKSGECTGGGQMWFAKCAGSGSACANVLREILSPIPGGEKVALLEVGTIQ